MDNVKFECTEACKGCGHRCKMEISEIDPIAEGATIEMPCLVPFPPIEGYAPKKTWKVI